MPDTLYDSVKALNWSSLKHIATSPLLYRYRIDHPEPRKPAFLLGNGIHCRVLEPDAFGSRYAECGVVRNKKHGAYQEWLAENEGREALKPAEMEHVKRAGDAVLAHPVAASILKGGRREEPLVWIDPITGMKCKGRVDFICPTYIVDLKSDRNPLPRVFNTKAARLMYHGQIAFYQTGAITAGKISGRIVQEWLPGCPACGEPQCDHNTNTDRAVYGRMPYIIAVEKTPPYDVGVYQIKPDDLDAGRNLCLSLMRKLEECISADWWPGACPDLQYLDLPHWAPGMNIDEEEDF